MNYLYSYKSSLKENQSIWSFVYDVQGLEKKPQSQSLRYVHREDYGNDNPMPFIFVDRYRFKII